MQASELANATDNAPVHTSLYDLHIEHGAKFVSFAGYSMPMNYPGGILAEHRHTRVHASLFDISHMSRFRIEGPESALALESICPADVIDLKPGRLRYTLLTNDDGGIIDDIMVHRAGKGFEIIGNAVQRSVDLAWLHKCIGERCDVHLDEHFSLLALQGPEAAAILRELNPEIDTLSFMQVRPLKLAGLDCHVARAGYTGEDGFEITVPVDAARTLARRLLAQPAVKLAGLGARDGLRLEAGLCLYGQDINTATTPIEAGLDWTIAKARREGGRRAGGFPGAGRIFEQMLLGPPRRWVGLLPDSRAPLRAGTVLTDSGGHETGIVTSGGYSPILERPVAVAYVESHDLDRGIEFFARVRDKQVPTALSRLPFVPHRYRRGKH